MPKVSIIVPIYNVERYLRNCIESIMAQSLKDIEIILVNDGSIDNCGKICNEYVKNDKRINVIHKQNGGLSDARNAGIKFAKGDFIGFVDGDDSIDQNMYEVLYNLCIDQNTDISTCLIKSDNINLKNDFLVESNVKVLDSKNAIHELYEGTLSGFSACNKLYKKEIFENILFPIGRVYEDAAVMYLLYDRAKKITFINYPLYNYTPRELSITRSGFSVKRFDVVSNYYETYDFMEKNYPEMCEKLNFIYFQTLKNMIADIIREKNLVDDLNFILRVSKQLRKINKKILSNNILSIREKLFAQIMAWCPKVGYYFCEIRIKQIDL
jgi:glycosyltransferase involved in cell wall biosynthesis